MKTKFLEKSEDEYGNWILNFLDLESKEVIRCDITGAQIIRLIVEYFDIVKHCNDCGRKLIRTKGKFTTIKCPKCGPIYGMQKKRFFRCFDVYAPVE